MHFSQSIKTHRKEILVALALVLALVALICWRACQTTGPQAKWKEATKPKLVTSAPSAPKGEIPSEPTDTKKPTLGDYLPWPKEQEAQYLREFGLTTWTGLSLARKELMTSTDPDGVLQLTNNADVNKLEIQFQRVADAEGRPLEEVAVDMMFAVRESFIFGMMVFPASLSCDWFGIVENLPFPIFGDVLKLRRRMICIWGICWIYCFAPKERSWREAN